MAPRTLSGDQETDDGRLVDQIAQGNRDAFNTLYRRHFEKLSRFVLRVTSRHELVGEIVNDTMMAVWQQSGQFEHRSRVSTWILGIAYRQCLKRLTKAKRDPPFQPIDDTEVAVSPKLDDRIEARERQQHLREALAKLPAQQRAVVELTLFRGLSYGEIADLLDCPEGTVKTRMFHARNQLKTLLARVPRPNSSPSAQAMP